MLCICQLFGRLLRHRLRAFHFLHQLLEVFLALFLFLLFLQLFLFRRIYINFELCTQIVREFNHLRTDISSLHLETLQITQEELAS